MCRSIKTLRYSDTRAGDDEIAAAALQFVRKVSGYRKPSHANQVVFDSAVNEVSDAVERLLGSLSSPARPGPARDSVSRSR